MAKQKKDCIALHVNADASIMKRFEKYCEEMGQSKTVALERILAAFLAEYEKKNKTSNNNN